MDYITIGIAIAAFVLSVYNFVYQLIIERKNLKVELIGVTQSFENAKWYVIELNFLNKSRLPISIADIWLSGNGNRKSVDTKKHQLAKMTERTGKTVTNEVIVMSDILPIDLGSLMTFRGKYVIDLVKSDFDISEGQSIDITLSTSRGVLTFKLEFLNFCSDEQWI